MVKILSLTTLVIASSLSLAQAKESKAHLIKSFETFELPVEGPCTKNEALTGMGIGEVIAVSGQIVALGEQVYTLVQKGKPNISVDYAPINVVPRDPISKQFVDPFELTGTSDPVRKRFVAFVKNFLNQEVVRFEYMLLFSYGGSWNGKGLYVQNAMIIPVSVTASYGWDFNAKMKLEGISNKGSAQNPIGAAILSMNYTIKGWSKSIDKTEVINIAGNGEFKVQ